jgi:hypothetical protein
MQRMQRMQLDSKRIELAFSLFSLLCFLCRQLGKYAPNAVSGYNQPSASNVE